jgi:hypothetical protein
MKVLDLQRLKGEAQKIPPKRPICAFYLCNVSIAPEKWNGWVPASISSGMEYILFEYSDIEGLGCAKSLGGSRKLLLEAMGHKA